jgi:twitching motility two-component system response regulator PilH
VRTPRTASDGRALDPEEPMPVKKILVVDDSPTDRQYMLETLARKGYQVVTAENGEDAIVKAKAELPDLILMDVVMPGLNGYQATRQITRDDATKHIPVIMCTSKGADTDKIWGMRQGANDYLVKPVDAAQLLAKIAQLSAAN